jgi:drug/metabolite transporter (DMT)-like permease
MSSAIQNVFSVRQKIVGITFAFVAAIGFSAKAIMVKLAYIDAVDAITLLALRMAFSLPFFLIVAARENRNKRRPPLTTKDKLAVIGLGLTGYYLASYLDFLGLQYISAGLERLILFLYPTMVVFISALVFKHCMGRSVWFALLISYAGIVLVFLHDMHILQHNVTDLNLPPRVYGLSMAMAVFSTVLPAFLLAAAMRRIGSMHTAMIGSIGPVSTIYLAYVFLGERLSLIQIIGSILVLAGVLMISLQQQKQN